MRLSSVLIRFAPFALAAFGAYFGAILAANLIEERSRAAVDIELRTQGLDWAEVTSSGLQLQLAGIAPTEAERFRALTIAGSIVDAARVIDLLEVQDAAQIAPPDFLVEVLRNDEGVSLIGLVPASTDRDAVVTSLEDLTEGEVTDLLEVADYPVPQGWDAALAFSLEAIGSLPRSKISVSPRRVEVTASSDSKDEKTQIERRLQRAAPSGLRLVMNITSPRPVITPFTLRFTISDGRARFDACSADTTETANRILAAARGAGIAAGTQCTLGLGSPSPSWGEAAAASIAAVTDLGGGTVTFSDADISLVALPTTPSETFDRVVGALESNLPDVFSLTAVLPEPVTIDGTGEGAGPPEFLATKSPEGLVQLRGRVPEDRTRSAIESFARARFGAANTYFGTRSDDGLPDGWPIRVLAGLDALSRLSNGSIVVQEEFVEVRGNTGNPDARAEISRILSDKLGEGENFELAITYQEALDPVAALPTPAECVSDLNAVLSASKITFEPGSANLGVGSSETIGIMADILKQCSTVRMEIGGHTDSQGREEMNAALSQSRAQAVLNALAARRILTSNLKAKGYGESQPIADNETEEGREANRRIEFKLIRDEAPEEETLLEEVAADSGDAAADETTEETGANE